MPSKKKPTGHKAALAAAALTERTVPLCLRTDLLAQLQELQRDLAEAERREGPGASLGGGDTVELARQIEAVRAQMAEHTIVVRFRALPRRKWATFLAGHPPRDGDEADRAVGYNRDTFYDALVRRCLAGPDFDEDDWARLEEILNDAQWQSLVNAAWAVNARDVSVPFSPAASRILRNSDDE